MATKANAPADDAGGAAEGGAADAPRASTDWAGAVKRIRDTNDWVVKVFVAVGALLVGTGPLLANLREIEFDDRGIVAAVGALASIVGAGGIAWLASNVSLTELTTITDLADPGNVSDETKRTALQALKRRVEADDSTRWLYLGGHGSVAGVVAARRGDARSLKEQTAVLPLIPATVAANPPAPNPERVELERIIALTRGNLSAYDALLKFLADWASFETVKARFVRNRRRMAWLGLLTFLGLCTWVVALGADLGEDDDSAAGGGAAATTPEVGELRWSTATDGGGPTPGAAAAADLRRQLGDGMDADECDEVGVLVEGGAGSAESPWQVSVLPRDPCPARLRFAVDRRLATIVDFRAVDNRTVEVELDERADRPTWWWWATAGLVVAVAVVGRRVGRPERTTLQSN